MNTERSEPDLTDAHAPVVTYSRLEPRKVSAAGLPADERREPTLEAARVLPLEGEVEPGLAEMPMDLRADRRGDEPPLDSDIATGLYDERRRRRPLRLLVFTAFIAIAAGVGVLASSLGAVTDIDDADETAATAVTATVTDKQASVSEAKSAETAKLDSADAAEPVNEVRKIPLGTEKSETVKADDTKSPEASETETASVPPAEPPVPRPRPEPTVAVLEPPATTGSTEEPADAPAPATASNSAPASDDGTDSLISRIEETLAKRETASAAQSTEASAEPSSPPVLLPPPPATVVSPNTADDPYSNYGYPRDYGYPSAGYDYPDDEYAADEDYTGDGPWVFEDAPPSPPVAGRDYYPPAPVPPAPVPYGYPADSWGPEATYRGELVEERPGVIKRALTRMSQIFNGRREAY